ncbi:MAG: tyrosine-type recombinase/integrase [Candidatus Omnitrophota bacterium]
MASIFLRNNTYWLSFYLNGKRIQYSLKVKDRRLALHLKRQKEIELEEGRAKLPTSKKLSEIVEEYKEYSKLKKAEKSLKTDIPQLEKFIKFSGANTLRDVKPHTIQLYLQSLKKLKPKSINNYIGNIRTFLNYAKRNNYIFDNPIDQIKKLKVPKEPPRYLSKDEISKLLEVSKESHLYPIIITALYTGMRIGEILNLEWKDIDLSNNTITIRGSKAKSRIFRTIPIHPMVSSTLHKIPHSTPFVFVYNGKKYTDEPKRAFKTLLVAAKINLGKGRLFHVLRHSCASWLVMSGVDLYTVGKILGHADFATTQIYAHLSPEHLKKAVETLKF